MKKFLIALGLCALHITAYAGQSSGKVTLLTINATNYLMFSAGTQVSPPGCSASNQWAVSLDTPKGKMFYAMLLSAIADGQTVNVVGTGDCADWADREKPLFMYVQPQ